MNDPVAPAPAAVVTSPQEQLAASPLTLLLLEQQQRWQSDAPLPVEALLERRPSLRSNASAVAVRSLSDFSSSLKMTASSWASIVSWPCRVSGAGVA